MAKKKSSKRSARQSQTTSANFGSRSQSLDTVNLFGSLKPGFLVTFRSKRTKQGLSAMFNAAGNMRVATAGEFLQMSAAEEMSNDSGVLLLEKMNIAVVDMDPTQAMAVQAASGGEIMSIAPEPIFFAYNLDYLRGFRDAVNQIADIVLAEESVSISAQGQMSFQDSDSLTWGLQAIGVSGSNLSGAGVKVAVLDTGMDLNHPDFLGRTINSRSFIAGQGVQDENGHGTHCIGTACGPRAPSTGRGYGVAYEAEIFAGKVLSNQGSSLGRSTLRGIEWAIEEGVDIISLSLGTPVGVGQGFVQAFEQVGQTAKQNGILIVAAAGNDSNRSSQIIQPVGSPANCPSFMAVAAIDRFSQIANFSNRGINPNGGGVDIAGPGVNTYSSAPDPAPPRQPPFFRQWTARNDAISGTSMATPHVAGVAALYKQANPGATPDQLRNTLIANAQQLSIPSSDVGAGLVRVTGNANQSNQRTGVSGG